MAPVAIFGIHLDVGSILVGIAISGFYFWLDRSARKPKLIGAGAGSGSGYGLSSSQLGLSNQPTFFGFKTAREPFRVASAWLCEAGGREVIGGGLVWDDQQGHVVQSITIEAGQQRSVRIFIAQQGGNDVFLYNAECFNAREALPQGLKRVPRDMRDFELHVSDHIGRLYRFRVVKDRDGVGVRFKITMADRRRRFVQGIRMILSAFGRRP